MIPRVVLMDVCGAAGKLFFLSGLEDSQRKYEEGSTQLPGTNMRGGAVRFYAYVGLTS